MATSRQNWIYHFNWPLLISLLVLLGVGMVNLFSATASAKGQVSPYFWSQVQWLALGAVVLLIALSFHYRRLLEWTPYFYWACILLLVAVLVVGTAAGGQKNWLVLGPIRVQPSELSKLAVLLMLSRHYAKQLPEDTTSLKSLLRPGLIVGLPLALILATGDLGAAIFLVAIGATYAFLTGIKKRWLALGMVLLVLAGAGGYQFLLKDYQRERIHTFLHPERDPQGRGYHLFQSKIAVGSGRIWGQGYREGHLHQLKFLPERHTDFVFSVWAEEWGLVGTLGLLLVITWFFFLLLQAARKVSDPFGSLIIAGVCTWFFWQWVFNVCGVLGLLPLAGVTLPFLSYGGSALLTNLAAMGLVFNVSLRRYMLT